MARKPARRSGTRRSGRTAAAGTLQERIVAALMRLAAARRYASVGLADVAAEAGVSLGEVRELYSGKGAILADFFKSIDQAVLARGPAEGDGPRDRLFDIAMRRLDLLAAHKAAVGRLVRAARCDGDLACALACMSKRSARWMLAAAGIHHGGVVGRLAEGGTVLVFAETVAVWLKDDDAGLAKTMATLDKALRRGERAMGFVGEVCDLAGPFMGGGRRGRRARRSEAAG